MSGEFRWCVFRLEDGAVEVSWREGLQRTTHRFEPDGRVEIRTTSAPSPDTESEDT